MHPLDRFQNCFFKGSHAYLLITSGIPVIPSVFEVLPQLVWCLLVGVVVRKVR